MVNWGMPLVTTDLKNLKCSSMLGWVRRIWPDSLNMGGCSSLAWKVCCLFTVSSTPSKPWMKSMCHQSRRNSPSVIACRPRLSCILTTSRMSRSWIAFSSAPESSPRRFLARASCRSWGRSRLPTWSARNGGFMDTSGWLGGELPCGGLLRRLFKCERLVGCFPGELGLLAAEVAVGGGLLVDWAQEIEHLDDASRPQIEVLGHERRERIVGHLARALRRHHDARRARDADRVGHLHQAFRGEARGDDVLRHIARRIGRRAVYLRGILAGKGATAMRGGAAVGVDDDL